MSEMRNIEINVPVLARVEGEGALELRIQNGNIEYLHLRIYEPPRYFEKFLEGRGYAEVPDIVARICGICPVAYQMSAVQALENIFGCDPGEWVRRMRRVMYCGEWIQSHALHIHLLAAPDFLGFNGAPEMAQKYPAEVRRGLMLQGLGNRIMHLFGGRSVHPVGVRVGGFHKAPARADVAALVAELRAALPDAEALVHWTAALPIPVDRQAFTCVALRHPQDYPLGEGRIISSDGLDIGSDEYAAHFAESHMAHSTALYSALRGGPYLVGPLARMNLNADRLPSSTLDLVRQTKIAFPSANMFHSIVARAAEIHCALVEAIRLLDNYAEPTASHVDVVPRAGIGFGCTEAPRGILWHRYETNARGEIVAARIVPPTSQNQARIEQDLRQSLQAYGLHHSDDELRLRGEMVIRNYDPCISCATHFLKMNVSRR